MATSEKVELNMTSMIDIVFQLLTFFIMTLKIVEAEGDFNIKMPQPGTAAAETDVPVVPMHLRLEGGANGSCKITLDNKALASFTDLRAEIIRQIAPGGGPVQGGSDMEVELDCDFGLQYKYVIEAITNVTGYRQGDQILKLIEKVKFARPRPEAGATGAGG